MSYSRMIRGGSVETRKEKAVEIPKEPVPGWEWFSIADGLFVVRPYVKHDKTTKHAIAPYERVAGTNIPLVIGVSVQKGPASPYKSVLNQYTAAEFLYVRDANGNDVRSGIVTDEVYAAFEAACEHMAAAVAAQEAEAKAKLPTIRTIAAPQLTPAPVAMPVAAATTPVAPRIAAKPTAAPAIVSRGKGKGK